LDRIEYRSYNDLERKLTHLLQQRFPKRIRPMEQQPHEVTEQQLAEVRELLYDHPEGLTLTSIAGALGIKVDDAYRILERMLQNEARDETGSGAYTTGSGESKKYVYSVPSPSFYITRNPGKG
jgi:hypothetical protein